MGENIKNKRVAKERKLTLRELRLSRGMTQQQFADFVEIPYSTYRKYETHSTGIELGRLMRICEKNGIPMERIKI